MLHLVAPVVRLDGDGGGDGAVSLTDSSLFFEVFFDGCFGIDLSFRVRVTFGRIRTEPAQDVDL